MQTSKHLTELREHTTSAHKHSQFYADYSVGHGN